MTNRIFPSPPAYASVFPDTSIVLELAELGRFNRYGRGGIEQLGWSVRSIVDWSDKLIEAGPWSVTTKSIIPPSGDVHDYMSLAPYWWPDCSGLGNTTELTPDEIYETCPYCRRDGVFNPDRRSVNNLGAFESLSESVLFSSLAFGITRNEIHARRAADAIRTWFLDDKTRMNPNLNYAQIIRGPRKDGKPRRGERIGVLDLKNMVHIAAGIEVLRVGGAQAWTRELDDGLKGWMKEYERWLRTNELALEEAGSSNNHASFYFAQLSAVQIILQDLPAAANTSRAYFSGVYQGQVEANGEQPLEAERTRPYHYRCYNLAAMITNARLGAYAGLKDVWDHTTKVGGTIKAACDYTMDISSGDEDPTELYPSVAAMHYVYGDERYVDFLDRADPEWKSEPYYLWNQHPDSVSLARSPLWQRSLAGSNDTVIVLAVVLTGLAIVVCRRRHVHLARRIRGRIGLPDVVARLGR